MLIVLNHKMNLTKEEVVAYEKIIREKTYDDTLVVCPSIAYLPYFQGENYKLGAQIVSQYDGGSHTGEVSAKQLRSLNVSHCLVGHSETRKDHNETQLELNKKIKVLLKNGIIPILCIGETQEERDQNKAEDVLTRDLRNCLRELSKEEISKVIVAYEPIWAIGSGNVPSNETIEQTVSIIKTFIEEQYQESVKVLYGGSINKHNYTILKTIFNVDGFLIGGFGLDVKGIQEMLEI